MFTSVMFLRDFYSHNLRHKQEIYRSLGPSYSGGAVLALELEPVSWLEDVAPKKVKAVMKRVMKRPSKS